VKGMECKSCKAFYISFFFAVCHPEFIEGQTQIFRKQSQKKFFQK